jgi:hypothetical protein
LGKFKKSGKGKQQPDEEGLHANLSESPAASTDSIAERQSQKKIGSPDDNPCASNEVEHEVGGQDKKEIEAELAAAQAQAKTEIKAAQALGKQQIGAAQQDSGKKISEAQAECSKKVAEVTSENVKMTAQLAAANSKLLHEAAERKQLFADLDQAEASLSADLERLLDAPAETKAEKSGAQTEAKAAAEKAVASPTSQYITQEAATDNESAEPDTATAALDASPLQSIALESTPHAVAMHSPDRVLSDDQTLRKDSQDSPDVQLNQKEDSEKREDASVSPLSRMSRSPYPITEATSELDTKRVPSPEPTLLPEATLLPNTSAEVNPEHKSSPSISHPASPMHPERAATHSALMALRESLNKLASERKEKGGLIEADGCRPPDGLNSQEHRFPSKYDGHVATKQWSIGNFISSVACWEQARESRQHFNVSRYRDLGKDPAARKTNIISRLTTEIEAKIIARRRKLAADAIFAELLRIDMERRVYMDLDSLERQRSRVQTNEKEEEERWRRIEENHLHASTPQQLRSEREASLSGVVEAEEQERGWRISEDGIRSMSGRSTYVDHSRKAINAEFTRLVWPGVESLAPAGEREAPLPPSRSRQNPVAVLYFCLTRRNVLLQPGHYQRLIHAMDIGEKDSSTSTKIDFTYEPKLETKSVTMARTVKVLSSAQTNRRSIQRVPADATQTPAGWFESLKTTV